MLYVNARAILTYLSIIITIACIFNVLSRIKGLRNNDITFESQSDTARQAALRSYKAQERTIGAFQRRNESQLQYVKKINSHRLPGRHYPNVPIRQLCRLHKTKCVPPFARIRPLIVTAPSHNLMSCITQKSMSTVMSAIFCFLLRQDEFIKEGRSILREYSDIRMCEGKNEFKSVDGMRRNLGITVRDLEKWTFTMVTRDPVDRFLSGFIDRCIRVGDNCFGCRTNMTCFLQQEYFRAQDYAFAEHFSLRKPYLTSEDIHIFPQNWRCNMDRYFAKYKFIRYSNDPSETLLSDISKIFTAQNISSSAISYISSSLQSGRTAHSTVTSPYRFFLEKRLRNSPYLMELIVRLFYYDYKLLKYPVPDIDELED